MADAEILLLVLVTLGAFGIPLLTRRLQMPNAAGEIIYGLLVGYLLIDRVHLPHSISFLGELGFILLMYLAGLEIDFNRIRKTPKAEIMVYCAMYAIVVLLSCLVVYILNLPLLKIQV